MHHWKEYAIVGCKWWRWSSKQHMYFKKINNCLATKMFGNKSFCIQKLFCIIKHCCSQNMFCVLERLFAGYNLFKLLSFKLFIAHASCMLLLSAPPTGGFCMLAGIVLIAVYIWAMHVHHWWCCWWWPHTQLLPVFPQAGFHCWCTSVFWWPVFLTLTNWWQLGYNNRCEV